MRVFTWIRRLVTAVGLGALWGFAMIWALGDSLVSIVFIGATSFGFGVLLNRFWMYRDDRIARLAPMRIRRHCYDKPHRCPGWAGGGRKIPRNGTSICQDGRLDLHMYEKRLWQWRFRRCGECDAVALPVVVKYLDPFWWVLWKIPMWRRDFAWWREDREEEKAARRWFL